MRLISNSSNQRAVDELRKCLGETAQLDLATSGYSLFAFADLRDLLGPIESCRLVLPTFVDSDLTLLGTDADRAARNQLLGPLLAKECRDWLLRKAIVREAPGVLPQCLISAISRAAGRQTVLVGNCPFTTQGLGLAVGNQFGLVQVCERDDECEMFRNWFAGVWQSCASGSDAKQRLLDLLQAIAEPKAPALAYHLVLFHLFKELGQEIDEERIVKSATGIRSTVVWQKLFKFQRDGVIGAIDKLERFGGCIIADSVGLGKTFEALAVIKYHELRNDRR